MAEISPNGASRSMNGKVRVKKLSTRIDMTPMVDLAFLLLTFFILTASLTKHKVMEVGVPDKPVPGDPLPRANVNDVLQLALAENNKVYWWIGENPKPELTNYSKDGIRKILLEKRATRPNLIVLIKPSDESKYQNIVDILDEIDITGVKTYCIVNFTDEDRSLIGNSEMVTFQRGG